MNVNSSQTPSTSAVRSDALKRCNGFTLIELLIVMAIVVVLFLIASPNYDSVMVGSRIDNARMSIATSVAMVRSEAVKQGQTASLCATGGSCDGSVTTATDWSDGWQAQINGASLQTIVREDRRVDIEYSCGDQLTFDASGERSNGGAGECVFTVSDPSGDGSLDKVLRIAPTGRVRLE